MRGEGKVGSDASGACESEGGIPSSRGRAKCARRKDGESCDDTSARRAQLVKMRGYQESATSAGYQNVATPAEELHRLRY